MTQKCLTWPEKQISILTLTCWTNWNIQGWLDFFVTAGVVQHLRPGFSCHLECFRFNLYFPFFSWSKLVILILISNYYFRQTVPDCYVMFSTYLAKHVVLYTFVSISSVCFVCILTAVSFTILLSKSNFLLSWIISHYNNPLVKLQNPNWK